MSTSALPMTADIQPQHIENSESILTEKPLSVNEEKELTEKGVRLFKRHRAFVLLVLIASFFEIYLSAIQAIEFTASLGVVGIVACSGLLLVNHLILKEGYKKLASFS